MEPVQAGRGVGGSWEEKEGPAHSHPHQAVPASRLLLVSLASPGPLSVPVEGKGRGVSKVPARALAFTKEKSVLQWGTT